MTVYHPTLQPIFAWPARTRFRLRFGQRTRRIIRVLLILLLALIFFLMSVETVVATPPADRYLVQPGDTLTAIALRHDVSVGELAAANGLTTDTWVFMGQTLVIPRAKPHGDALTSEPATQPLDATDPRVPDPLPTLPVLPQEQPARITPFSYAQVVEDNVPVYGSPEEIVQGAAPKRRLGSGYIWVSVGPRTTVAGQDYYQINVGEYVAAEVLSFYTPSGFQGVALAAQPERPFAWILTPVWPTLTPGGEVNPAASAYRRYELVQIFATEQLGDQVWYLIGPHQWINQIYVGKVAPSARPEGVAPEAAWIEVNLFEQTLTADVGDQMVYATLVSSGLPGWDTPKGLNRVWLKVKAGKMSGAQGRPDYYFLEDVPWTMYFNKDVALHAAYWHDGFGYKHSHGCVNLAPLDARWLFEWAPKDAWIWVH
jgi:LysM repeat protein